MLRPPTRAVEQHFWCIIHRRYHLHFFHDARFISPSSQVRRRRQQHQQLQQTTQLFSTSSAHGHSGGTTTWERGAKIVKDTDIVNPYLDRVRSEVVDPALHLKTIEDELCGAIGKALGKQGEKVSFAIDEMKVAHTQYLECIHAQSYERALQCAQLHNDARKRAIQARWELLVHRQAVGFTVDNHSVVHKTFPISDALPVTMEEIQNKISSNGGHCDHQPMQKNTEHYRSKKSWGDQLSWWERVGRWK
ncbi:hypothetical protein ACHAXH_005561 [Discostella pseudostelligera]